MKEDTEIIKKEEVKPVKKTITTTQHICGTCQKSVVKMLPAIYHGESPICCGNPMSEK